MKIGYRLALIENNLHSLLSTHSNESIVSPLIRPDFPDARIALVRWEYTKKKHNLNKHYIWSNWQNSLRMGPTHFNALVVTFIYTAIKRKILILR